MTKLYCLVILISTSVVLVSRYLRSFVILWIPLVFLNGCIVLSTFMVILWTWYSPMVFPLCSLSVGHYELCRDDIGDLPGSPDHL